MRCPPVLRKSKTSATTYEADASSSSTALGKPLQVRPAHDLLMRRGVFELLECRTQIDSEHLEEIRRCRQVPRRFFGIQVEELVLNSKALDRQRNAVSGLPIIARPVDFYGPMTIEDKMHPPAWTPLAS